MFVLVDRLGALLGMFVVVGIGSVCCCWPLKHLLLLIGSRSFGIGLVVHLCLLWLLVAVCYCCCVGGFLLYLFYLFVLLFCLYLFGVAVVVCLLLFICCLMVFCLYCACVCCAGNAG